MSLISSWSSINYWQKLCSYLSISDKDCPGFSAKEAHQTQNTNLQHRLIQDGYALIDAHCNSGLREKLARVISDLETKYSLPATFALLYDETWHMALQSQRYLLSKSNILHPSMTFNFDMLAWHIDQHKNQVGFSPHRDRQPDTDEGLKQSFYEDGHAKYVTHWIALTDANPNNSCLYIIPKQFDPGYLKGDDPPNETEHTDTKENVSKDSNTVLPDPLTRALPTKQSYQNIRALPRQPGQSVIFTHRILHWGSAGNPHYKVEPRIAISFVYSDAGFEAPYLTNFALKEKPPPFELRLLLVCSQLLIYHQRFDLSAFYLRACYDYVKLHEMELNEVYRKKVYVEFVKAMKEHRDGVDDGMEEDNANTNIADTTNNNVDVDSDDEDAMLEAMLDNEEEFEDDFDDLENEKKNDRKRARVTD